ncbi:hypothetical protein ABW20_dc0110521 [Dactylellina cionopaga]|nr:hypothetical protein ABW20_dc0110521 [Dactylellina cionopaga]
MVVKKCGNVITIRHPRSETPSVSSKVVGSIPSPKSFNKKKYDSKISPCRPAPKPKSKEPVLCTCPPDLDGFIIADSDDDDQTVTADTTHPSKKKPLAKVQTPKHGRPKKSLDLLSKATTKPETPKKKDIPEVPTNIPTTLSGNESPDLRNRYPSTPVSIETSPIKRILDNKSSRLRTQSNLKKISTLRINNSKLPLSFDMASPPKYSLVTHPKRDDSDTDTLNLIESYFQRNVEQMDVTDKSDDLLESPPVTISRSRLPKQQYRHGPGDLGPSLLVFPMDEDMQLQEELSRSARERQKFMDEDACRKFKGKTHTGCTIPGLTSNEYTMADSNGQTRLSQDLTVQARSTGTVKTHEVKIETKPPGQDWNHITGELKYDIIEAQDISDPTILNLEVGVGGLVINVYCTGNIILKGLDRL